MGDTEVKLCIVCDSALSPALFSQIASMCIGPITLRLQEKHRGKIEAGLITYTTATNRPTVITQRAFCDPRYLFPLCANSPHLLGIGATGLGGMAMLEGLVSAIEMCDDTLESSARNQRVRRLNYSTAAQPPRSAVILHILLIGNSKIDPTVRRPFYNQSTSLDNVTWESLSGELSKRNINLSLCILSPPNPKEHPILAVHNKLCPVSDPVWFKKPANFTILLSGTHVPDANNLAKRPLDILSTSNKRLKGDSPKPGPRQIPPRNEMPAPAPPPSQMPHQPATSSLPVPPTPPVAAPTPPQPPITAQAPVVSLADTANAPQASSSETQPARTAPSPVQPLPQVSPPQPPAQPPQLSIQQTPEFRQSFDIYKRIFVALRTNPNAPSTQQLMSKGFRIDDRGQLVGGAGVIFNIRGQTGPGMLKPPNVHIAGWEQSRLLAARGTEPPQGSRTLQDQMAWLQQGSFPTTSPGRATSHAQGSAEPTHNSPPSNPSPSHIHAQPTTGLGTTQILGAPPSQQSAQAPTPQPSSGGTPRIGGATPQHSTMPSQNSGIGGNQHATPMSQVHMTPQSNIAFTPQSHAAHTPQHVATPQHIVSTPQQPLTHETPQHHLTPQDTSGTPRLAPAAQRVQPLPPPPPPASHTSVPQNPIPGMSQASDPSAQNQSPQEVWKGQIVYPLRQKEDQVPTQLGFSALAANAPGHDLMTHRWPARLFQSTGFKAMPRQVATQLYAISSRTPIARPFGQIVIDQEHAESDNQKYAVFQKVITAGYSIFYEFPHDPAHPLPANAPQGSAFGLLFFNPPNAPGRILFQVFINEPCPPLLCRGGQPAGPGLMGNNTSNGGGSGAASTSNAANRSPSLLAGPTPGGSMNTIPGGGGGVAGAGSNLQNPGTNGMPGIQSSPVPSGSRVVPGASMIPGAGAGIRPNPTPPNAGVNSGIGTNPMEAQGQSMGSASSGIPQTFAGLGVPGLGVGPSASNTSGLNQADLQNLGPIQPPGANGAAANQPINVLQAVWPMAMARLGFTHATFATATTPQKQQVLQLARQLGLQLQQRQRAIVAGGMAANAGGGAGAGMGMGIGMGGMPGQPGTMPGQAGLEMLQARIRQQQQRQGGQQ